MKEIQERLLYHLFHQSYYSKIVIILVQSRTYFSLFGSIGTHLKSNLFVNSVYPFPIDLRILVLRSNLVSQSTSSATNTTMRRSSRLAASAATPSVKSSNASPSPKKRIRSSIKEETDRSHSMPLTPPATPNVKRIKQEEDSKSPQKTKRIKSEPKSTAERKLASLRQSLAKEPFPQWNKPTHEEAQLVAEILTKSHGYKTMPKKQPPKGDDRYGGCGDVSDVLDATIRTILSCNTSGSNSRAAHKSLCDTFGKLNWQAILDAKHSEVANSIRCGGLHENKAKTIQGVLRQTKEKYGILSLNHLHGADAKTVMEELVAFNGVGPKVASCVAMFALGLSEMAVDTHVHRLCRKLAWVPDKASRDQTYYHLAARIPDHLKYPLHVLLIKHGKACSQCSARGFATDRYSSPEWAKEGMSVISGIKKEDWGDDVKANADKRAKYESVRCPLAQAGLFNKSRKVVKKEEDTTIKQEIEDVKTNMIKKEEE